VKRLYIRIGDTINPVAVLFGIGREFPRCKGSLTCLEVHPRAEDLSGQVEVSKVLNELKLDLTATSAALGDVSEPVDCSLQMIFSSRH
jgi:hypothetical protein